MGNTQKTDTSEEFKALERETDQRFHALERTNDACDRYMRALSKNEFRIEQQFSKLINYSITHTTIENS